MKKIATVTVLVLSVLILSFTAYCENARVKDNAGVLTASEEKGLEGLLSQKIKQYSFDMAILIEDYVNGAQSYADEFYDSNSLGFGDGRDGLLFLVTNDGVYFSARGFGNKAIIPYSTELAEDFLIDVEEQGYAYAFNRFIGSVCECLTVEREMYENGIEEESTSEKLYGFITDEAESKENGETEKSEEADVNSEYSLAAKLAAVVFIGGAIVAILIVERRKNR